jgi:hypothetical protein
MGGCWSSGGSTKLRLHSTTSKASLCYGSENGIINKRDAPKPEAAQMIFVRPLLGPPEKP